MLPLQHDCVNTQSSASVLMIHSRSLLCVSFQSIYEMYIHTAVGWVGTSYHDINNQNANTGRLHQVSKLPRFHQIFMHDVGDTEISAALFMIPANVMPEQDDCVNTCSSALLQLVHFLGWVISVGVSFETFHPHYWTYSYTLPAKNMEYFLFQRFFAFLWSVQGVSIF